MKTLLLARHAKSDWNQPSGNVALMAAHLQKNEYAPEQIISSDAARALATASEYNAALNPQKGLIENHHLYNASLQDILQVIKNIPEANNTVMLVGHNPGMSEALNYFLPSKAPDMQTCSVGILRFDIVQWSESAAGSGELLAFECPKNL